MPRRGRGVRIARGIFRSDHGYSVIARAGQRRKERHFPLETPLRDLIAWQEETRSGFRRLGTLRVAILSRDTLEADALRYLETLTGTAKRDAKALLSHWLAVLGHRRRPSLVLSDLRAVVASWLVKGIAASTINHRRDALIRLYDALDGPDRFSLPRQLARQRAEMRLPRAIPIALAERIIDAMADTGQRLKGYRLGPHTRSKSKARARVMLWTGLPQSTLMRVRPEHFDEVAATLTIQPRRKGRGHPGATVPLLPHAVSALRTFFRVRAWGRFSTDSLQGSFQRACRRAHAEAVEHGQPFALPPGFRVYDLRHSFLSEVLRVTGDLAAVQELAQHADIRTTLVYTRLAVSGRARAAIALVALERGGQAE